MKKHILFLFAFSGFLVISFGVAAILYAQSLQGIKFTGTPPTCNGTATNTLTVQDGTLKVCYNSSWSTVTGGGGGSSDWTQSGSYLYPSSTSWNVGIGTTTPAVALDVAGVIRASNYIQTSNYVQATNYMQAGYFYIPSYETVIRGDNMRLYANGRFSYGADGSMSWGLWSGAIHLYKSATGNIGIATTTPSYPLDVVGGAQFSQPILVATPTSGGHATTKAYVDSLVAGANYWSSDGTTLTPNPSTLKMSIPGNGVPSDSQLIVGSGSGKIDVGTIDPVYTIGGNHYATYMPGMTGVKEETAGVINIQCQTKCSEVLDFKNAEVGSDLWLFSRVTNLKNNFDKLSVLLSPGFEGNAWYKKDAGQMRITIYSTMPGEVSYRLTAPRFDTSLWKNLRPDEMEGFNLDKLIRE